MSRRALRVSCDLHNSGLVYEQPIVFDSTLLDVEPGRPKTRTPAVRRCGLGRAETVLHVRRIRKESGEGSDEVLETEEVEDEAVAVGVRMFQDPELDMKGRWRRSGRAADHSGLSLT